MAGAIKVDHAADSYEVASFVPRDRRANPGDTAHDLVAGDAGIDRGHDIAPLVTDLMKIGVANAAEEISSCTSRSVESRREIVAEASGDVALAAE